MNTYPTGEKFQGVQMPRPFVVPTLNVGAHPQTISLTMEVSGESEPVLVRSLNFIGSAFVTLQTNTATENQQILLANTSPVTASVQAIGATILGAAVVRLQPGEQIAIIFDGVNFILNV